MNLSSRDYSYEMYPVRKDVWIEKWLFRIERDFFLQMFKKWVSFK